MIRWKVGGVGVMIIIAFDLTLIAMFIPNWIFYSGKGIEMIPYQSDSATWFKAASCMMFTVFGLFFPLICVYLYTGWKVYHHISSHHIRHWYTIISLLTLLITFLQSMAVVLVACNIDTFIHFVATLGSSAYLTLTSTIIMAVALGLNEHIFRYHVNS